MSTLLEGRVQRLIFLPCCTVQAALQPTPRLIINALTYFNHYHVCFYSRASCQKTRYSVVPSSAEEDQEKLELMGKHCNIFKGNKVTVIETD